MPMLAPLGNNMLIKDLLSLKTPIQTNESDDHDDKSFDEKVQEFLSNEGHYSLEGRRGLIALCSLVGALGYKDHGHSMQLSSTASVGDLVEFLQDNSGAIEAVVDWIMRQNVPEWEENLSYEE